MKPLGDQPRMPVMVMVANTEMVAPPMTHWGMVVSRGGEAGTSPATSRMRGRQGEDRPVDDPVDGDDAHVLAVGGGGRAAEEGPECS